MRCALSCRGYGRVDVIASEVDNDVILEVNSLPAFTPTSLLPKMAKRAGLSNEDLVETILERATLDELVQPLGTTGARRMRAIRPRIV